MPVRVGRDRSTSRSSRTEPWPSPRQRSTSRSCPHRPRGFSSATSSLCGASRGPAPATSGVLGGHVVLEENPCIVKTRQLLGPVTRSERKGRRVRDAADRSRRRDPRGSHPVDGRRSDSSPTVAPGGSRELAGRPAVAPRQRARPGGDQRLGRHRRSCSPPSREALSPAGDPSAGFAGPTVLGELRRHFRHATWDVRPPRGLRELFGALDHACAEDRARAGEEATVTKLAGHLRRSPEGSKRDCKPPDAAGCPRSRSRGTTATRTQAPSRKASGCACASSTA